MENSTLASMLTLIQEVALSQLPMYLIVLFPNRHFHTLATITFKYSYNSDKLFLQHFSNQTKETSQHTLSKKDYY